MTRRGPDGSGEITPVSELFTYHIFGVPSECEAFLYDPASYRLRITGMVEHRRALTLEEIRNRYERAAGAMVLQCTTNVHWGRLRMAGARLLDVLADVGVRSGASKAVFKSADGFETDLRLSAIEASPDAFLLAYLMNDEPITRDHGFPVRLTADGRYGYKWPKWLVEVELVDTDYKGHYEGNRGWSDEGVRGRPVT